MGEYSLIFCFVFPPLLYFVPPPLFFLFLPFSSLPYSPSLPKSTLGSAKGL